MILMLMVEVFILYVHLLMIYIYITSYAVYDLLAAEAVPEKRLSLGVKPTRR